MKKVLTGAMLGMLAVSLMACSSADNGKGSSDLSKPVETVDEAWEQLDELNYSFSKIGDAEWVETAAPMTVQCPADIEKVQVFTGKKGIFSPEKYSLEEITKELSKSLESSGLDTEEAETVPAEGAEEKPMNSSTVYAYNDENVNISLTVDDTGYIDLVSYSKCVPGDINDRWSAPGRAPIIDNSNKDEIGLEDEAAEEEAPAAEEEQSE